MPPTTKRPWSEECVNSEDILVSGFSICGTDLTKPLKPKLVFVIFKKSLRTSKTTPHFAIAKINWLKLFKEIIAVYSQNHTKPLNKKYRVFS
jgi:hypothetical protein